MARSSLSSELADIKVSIIVMAYQHERYIASAIIGAISQTYSNLEIIISDDHSQDGTYDEAKKVVEANPCGHAIVLKRNDENMGFVKHFNHLLQISTGELVVYAPGDDISKPERVATIVDEYRKIRGERVLFYSSAISIDSNGVIDKVLTTDFSWRDSKKMAVSSDLYIGATGAFSRSLINAFPPIQVVGCYEDLVWGFRAYLCGKLIRIDKELIYYRLGGMSFLPECNNDKNMLRKKINKLKIIIYRQRLLDVEYYYNSKNDKLFKILEYRIRLEHAIGAVINKNWYSFLRYFLRSPKAALHALQKLYRDNYFF